MKWSLLVGKFWGTEIRLHASLLLLIPYVLLMFNPDSISAGVRILLLTAGLFICVGLHEVGHTLAARLFGVHVNSIVLWPLGGFASLTRRPEKAWQDVVISAAGPLTNLLIFLYLAVLTSASRIIECAYTLPWLSRFMADNLVTPFLLSLALANLSLAVFNLVPVYPLDGGQIARSLLKAIFGEKRADQVLIIFSLPMALLLAGIGVVLRDPIVVITGLLLALTALTLSFHLTSNILMAGLYVVDRAGYYLRKQDYDPAIELYTRAIERKPNLPGPYISRAIASMNLMNLLQAQADIDRALALDSNNPVAWALRGEIYMLHQQTDAAVHALNRAIQLKPNWALPYLDLGGVYQDQGDLQRALVEINKGVDLGNSAAVGYLLRSILRYQMDDLPGARSDADQALRYAPTYMLVFPELFLENLKDNLSWALDYYYRAMERMPGAYQPYQGRADVCRINGRNDWALLDYHRAIERAPKEAELYLNRGKSYRQLGALEDAANDFQQAAQLARRSHIRRIAQRCLKQIQEQTADASKTVTAVTANAEIPAATETG